VICFALPFLGNVRIRWRFRFASVENLLSRIAVDVVYVHGLWMSGGESLFLRRRLANEFGLQVHPFRYSAALSTMTEITARLQSFVESLASPMVHFVGHSLGGLVIYRFLERFPEQPPGRAVFMGTPSVASKVAEQAGHSRLVASLMGQPVADELLQPQERRWTVDRPLGIIAGTQPIGVGQMLVQFEEDSDGTVAVSETRLPGATDHLMLPVSHLGMLVSPRVAREIGTFLQEGRFTLGV
jgi:pimeloyl-ACP methyl ester carboxylesterase